MWPQQRCRHSQSDWDELRARVAAMAASHADVKEKSNDCVGHEGAVATSAKICVVHGINDNIRALQDAIPPALRSGECVTSRIDRLRRREVDPLKDGFAWVNGPELH